MYWKYIFKNFVLKGCMFKNIYRPLENYIKALELTLAT